MPRRLGQHFLRRSAVERLLRLIVPAPDDVFVEVGAGAGALTLPLAQRCREVIAIEIDHRLVERLAGRAQNVRVIHADALTVDLLALTPPASRLVGNLPYAVSSPLLRRFLELRERLRDFHLMLQEEVAERVASGPGSKDYGILSVLYAVWTNTDVPLRFPPGAFNPPPRVRSAVLRGSFLKEARVQVRSADRFESLLQMAFAHRRKTLENNLKDSYPNLKEYLRLLHIEGTRRAETLSVADFASLARALVLD